MQAGGTDWLGPNWKSPAGFGRQQAKYEPAMLPGNKDGQCDPGLY